MTVAATTAIGGRSGGSGKHGTVTGVFLMSAGRRQRAVRLPGRVIASSTNSQRFTVSVSTGGRFAIDLPPGTHQLTGYSPLHDGDREMRCVAAHPGLRVVHNGAELVDLGDELLQEHAHRNRTESAASSPPVDVAGTRRSASWTCHRGSSRHAREFEKRHRQGSSAGDGGDTTPDNVSMLHRRNLFCYRGDTLERALDNRRSIGAAGAWLGDSWNSAVIAIGEAAGAGNQRAGHRSEVDRAEVRHRLTCHALARQVSHPGARRPRWPRRRPPGLG